MSTEIIGTEVRLILPELAVLAGALLTFFASAFARPGSPKLPWALGTAAALLAVLASGLSLEVTGFVLDAGTYRLDALSQLLKLALASGLLLVMLLSHHLGSVRQSARGDVPLFFFLTTLGMMMLVSASELITLYVSLELSAYGLYILAVLHRQQRAGSEGAARYLLFGAAASAFSLYGLTLVFGAAGSTALAGLAVAAATPAGLLGIVLLLSGLFFKLAIFPFHAWAPDAYQGAPHQAAAFIGTVSKVAALGILVRILTLAGPSDTLIRLLLVLSVASMTAGNLAAMVQNDLKRLLGWSAVAHGGYLLIGLLTFSTTGNAAAIFYVLVYLLVALCPFIVISELGRDGDNPTRTELRGLARRSPLLAALLLVGMFGLAGIPPTPGFAGKWFLFAAALERDLFWLVFIAAINATISLYYYLQLVRDAWVAEPAADAPPLALSPPTLAVAVVTLVLTVLAGFFPGPLWSMATAAAAALGGG